ncbi:MAG: hypothetical protein V3W31_05525 [Thermodesulfobacteriota bacterium]
MKLKIPAGVKDIKKIKIHYVDPDVHEQKGLFGSGCYESDCDDVCCEYGCDVDLGSLKLIHRYRHLIEPIIKAKIEDCFSTEIKADTDYIGGAFRETAVRESDERCAFHLIGKQGCSLFYLWRTKGLTKRLVPTICRSYPITWHRGRLFVDRPLRRSCKCMEAAPGGEKVPSLFQTQAREIRALFDIQERKRKKKKKTPRRKAAKRA